MGVEVWVGTGGRGGGKGWGWGSGGVDEGFILAVARRPSTQRQYTSVECYSSRLRPFCCNV